MLEPYAAMGHAHSGGGGNETLDPGLLATTGPQALVDWVLLELRDGNDASVVLATKSALLRRDGSVVDVRGSTDLAFPIAMDVHYLRVSHRNHLGCMLATGLEFDVPPPILDFRDPDSLFTLGTQARKVINNTAVLWAGDVTFNGTIKYTGAANDRDPVLQAIGGSLPTNSVNGYLQEDVNLNGQVKYTGSANDRDPILQNIGGSLPTNTRTEQLP